MGTLYNRLVMLCEKRGVKGGKMCTDLGLSKSLMTDLKSGRKKTISAPTAHKIATYFDVSVGYLLGDEIEKAPTENGERTVDLSEVDVAFYNGFNELSEDDKETIRDMVRIMRERRAAKQENK